MGTKVITGGNFTFVYEEDKAKTISEEEKRAIKEAMDLARKRREIEKKEEIESYQKTQKMLEAFKKKKAKPKVKIIKKKPFLTRIKKEVLDMVKAI